MQQKRFIFKCPKHYDLGMVCLSHGWINLAPFSWDGDHGCLRFAVYMDSEAIDISVSQTKFHIEAVVSSGSGIGNPLEERLKAVIVRSLGLTDDTTGLFLQAEKVGPAYATLIRQGAGRLLRAPTVWEDAAKTLFTTNCSWAMTKKMCAAACSDQFVTPAPSGRYPFPPPSRFLVADENSLRKSMPIGYRAAYLLALAQQFAEDPNPQGLGERINDSAAALKVIRRFKGFGSYASRHMLVLTGFFDQVPIDTIVRSYLKSAHKARKPEAFIKRHYRKWGAYRWWGFKLEKMIYQQNRLGD